MLPNHHILLLLHIILIALLVVSFRNLISRKTGCKVKFLSLTRGNNWVCKVNLAKFLTKLLYLVRIVNITSNGQWSPFLNYYKGSKCATPTPHSVSSTCSSCVYQPVQRLFFTLAATMNHTVFFGDTKDAFVHSPSLNNLPTCGLMTRLFWMLDSMLFKAHQPLTCPPCSLLSSGSSREW